MTPWTLRVGKARAANVVVVCSAVLLAGCGAVSGTSNPTGAAAATGELTTSHLSAPQQTIPPSPANRMVGDLSQAVDYPQFGTRLDPPGQAAPSLSATDAVTLCSNPHSGVTCEPGQPMSIALALVTDAGMGMHRRLMWVMSWASVGCGLIGPAHTHPDPLVSDVTCDFVTFVDANTGANSMAIRGAGLVS